MSVKTGKTPGKGSAATGKQKRGADVPPVVLVIVGVVLVLAIGAGVFYVVNGGWQTTAQKEWQAQHVDIPLHEARRGRTDLLDAENNRRKAAGEAPLMVRDRHETATNVRQKLQEMQSRMGQGQGQAP